MKTIKNKILLNYTIIVLITLLSLEFGLILFAKNYYYNTIENYLRSRGDYFNEVYNKDITPHTDFDTKVRTMYKKIIQSDEKSRVQIINKNYEIIVDNMGVTRREKISSPDVKKTLESGEINFRKDLVVNSEKLYAISVPIKEYNITTGVVRFSVSLEKVDEGVKRIIILCILVGIGVLLVVLTASLLLAKSIVSPIHELKKAAKQMADGNYDVRAKKMSEDEIGDLSETFNYMAEEIENSEKIKNDFISSISHELRTPLTSIQGWSETLMIEDDAEDRAIGLSIIESETKRLINLVEDLLDFSRYQKKTFSFEMKDVNISNVVRYVANQYKVKANEKKINLVTEIEEKDKIITGDEGRLTQLMINLLENAYKFTDYNGKIIIRAYSEDDKFKIEVEDDGIGIDKENLDKIFDKFFKVNANKPGSGIGLALCHEIVVRHDGEIFVDSEKGSGTKFTIIF